MLEALCYRLDESQNGSTYTALIVVNSPCLEVCHTQSLDNMTSSVRMECFVTVVFAYILVEALASRHLSASFPQVPLTIFQPVCDGDVMILPSLIVP